MALTPDGGEKTVLFDITNYTHIHAKNIPTDLLTLTASKLYTSDNLSNL
jgi:hypothetical protein